MQVSIIIVNYNTKDLLVQCIQSVYRYVPSDLFEIVVVDNASADGSCQVIKGRFPEVILIESANNIGFGKANNLGITLASGKYVFLLNSDTYLVDDAISNFIAYMDDHQGVACCGADLIDEKGGRQVSFGNFPSLQEAFSMLGFLIFYRRYFVENIASAVKNYDTLVKEVDYISGADLFIRRSALVETGVFDPDFFLYFEETELCWRFKKMGFLSVLLPAIRIVHLEGGSQELNKEFNYTKIRMFAHSRNIFFKKCYGNVYAGIAKLLFTLHALILFLTKRKSGYFLTAKIIMNS